MNNQSFAENAEEEQHTEHQIDAVRQEDDAESAPPKSLQEQRCEEWYHLFGQMREFLNQKPSQHPLYDAACSSVRKKESLDYYRGLYDALAGTLRFLDVARKLAADNAEANNIPANQVAADAHEPIVVDMLRLQIGLAMSRMLKRWPDEWTPQLQHKRATSGSEQR